MRATNASIKRSAMLACTRIRDPAMQICPLLPKALTSAPSIARSKSASSKMILADLPSNSKCTGVSRAAAALMISRAVLPRPVSDIRSTPSAVASAAPVTEPRPLTRFTTPEGSPADSNKRTSWSTARGANSEGLRTQLLPKAMHEAICMLDKARHAFQGV